MKILLVLGNGFTIDFVGNCLPKSVGIDPVNLFTRGANVPAPGGGMYGFLSAKHTPALWALNARPYTNSKDAAIIFEDILSATQTYFSHEKKSSFLNETGGLRATHLRAYCELAYYLRALFIRYDRHHDEISGESWAWTEFLIGLSKNQTIDEVVVVSYNYDLWLERLLKKSDISFAYANEPDLLAKFTIYKPHGSINFVPMTDQNVQAAATVGSLTTEVQYSLEEQDIPKEVSVIQDNFSDHWTKYTLIPPAGDSGRLSAKWNRKLRTELQEKLKTWDELDRTIVCGLSYWHVDRNEIDEVLCSINPSSEVLMINPAPPSTLDATLTTLFRNYTCFLGSDILREVGNDL